MRWFLLHDEPGEDISSVFVRFSGRFKPQRCSVAARHPQRRTYNNDIGIVVAISGDRGTRLISTIIFERAGIAAYVLSLGKCSL